MADRLELVYQKELFVLAIQIAQKAGVSIQQQNVMFRRYGDHLYHQKDYDTAMQQYLRAIDSTEPSQVIRTVGLAMRAFESLLIAIRSI